MNRSYGENRWEKIALRIEPSASRCAEVAAQEIADLIRENDSEGRPTVLGLATGSTPLGVYRALIRHHREEKLSFRRVITFNLDEYFPLAPDAPQSYHRYMWENLFSHIDILRTNVHIPEGNIPLEDVTAHCREYELKIEKAGGLDLQILGIGRTGHIGFNEPGSQIKSRTRLITLDYMTRSDAAPTWHGLHHVPTRAITMGIRTILQARRILLLALGEHKASIVREAIEGPISDQIPATFLQTHENVTCLLDRGAASELTRLQAPWLLGPLADQGLAWDEKLIARAVLWLAQKSGKAILKLTDEDYNIAGLQELLATVGSAYDLNLKGFYRLQNAITGWPGGRSDGSRPKPLKAKSAEVFPKRIVIFSPHPDDDVISMGGTLARLADQGHEIHVAYQVSGSYAVPDEILKRYRAFAQGAATGAEPVNGESEIIRQRGLIRRLEAQAAARISGIPEDRLHFLDLPFYEKRNPSGRSIGDADLDKVKSLIEALQPHQIYAAGDLNDPHGTHRLCLEVIQRVWRSLAAKEWAATCEGWLYRGAWGEWPLHEIDMAVPLSPGEVLRKRRAIFQHETQKDQALFLGADQREFWQRVEARNKGTAEAFNRLGLADYEAIETFSRWSLV
jgi:glucosamine-6-phosphate deaminase